MLQGEGNRRQGLKGTLQSQSVDHGCGGDGEPLGACGQADARDLKGYSGLKG